MEKDKNESRVNVNLSNKQRTREPPGAQNPKKRGTERKKRKTMNTGTGLKGARRWVRGEKVVSLPGPSQNRKTSKWRVRGGAAGGCNPEKTYGRRGHCPETKQAWEHKVAVKKPDWTLI